MAEIETRTEQMITWTCPHHGTTTESLEDDLCGPSWDRDCCSAAWRRQLKWDGFVERVLGNREQDAQNKKSSDAGQWAGPAYVPCTPQELMEWALASIARDDEEFDYGFNVLYKQEKEEEYERSLR